MQSIAKTITLEQVLYGQAPKPFTFMAYHEFLTKKQSEENAEFLVDLIMYRRVSGRYYPNSIDGEHTSDLLMNETKIPSYTVPDDITPAEFEMKMTAVKTRLHSLEEKYLRPESPCEINLPSKIIRPLLALIGNGVYHPDIFNEAYAHVEEMLQQNGFDKFLNETTEQYDIEMNKSRRQSSSDCSGGVLTEPYPSSRKSSRDNGKRCGFLAVEDLASKIRAPDVLKPIAMGTSFSKRRVLSSSTPQLNIPVLAPQKLPTIFSPGIQEPSNDVVQSPTRRPRSASVDLITKADSLSVVDGSSPVISTFQRPKSSVSVENILVPELSICNSEGSRIIIEFS